MSALLLAPCSAEAPLRFRLGEPRTLLGDRALGLRYFPDGALAIVQRQPTLKLLLAAGVNSYRVEGEGLDRLTTASLVLRPGAPGNFDNGYAGIGGCYRHADGTLYAFYHAEDHEAMPRLANGVKGFYASIGMAQVIGKKDGALELKRLGPCLTGALPKDPRGLADQGIGEPCVVADRAGRYLYAYYTDHTHQDGRAVQICLARADLREGAPRPGRWMKFYQGAFTEPGLGGRETPVLSAAPSAALFPQVTWSARLGRYLMLFNINSGREMKQSPKPEITGIYLATSADGIAWSPPQQLFKEWSIAWPDKPVAWHPTLIWDDETGRSGQGWLVYSFSPAWGFPTRQYPGRLPHYLVGRRFEILPL